MLNKSHTDRLHHTILCHRLLMTLCMAGTQAHIHTDTQTKAISRNQAHASLCTPGLKRQMNKDNTSDKLPTYQLHCTLLCWPAILKYTYSAILIRPTYSPISFITDIVKIHNHVSCGKESWMCKTEVLFT